METAYDTYSVGILKSTDGGHNMECNFSHAQDVSDQIGFPKDCSFTRPILKS